MSKTAMLKLFNEFNYKYSLWDVFQDFSFIAAACFSNRVDLLNFKKRENEYFRMIKKYNTNDLNRFAKILAELINELSISPSDILGEIFMELDLGSHFKGQFFTPYKLSLATAEVMIGNNDIQKIIDQQGYVTLNEPACGSAGMVIAFAEAMKKRGFNPQKQLLVEATDLDVKCVHMAYAQLSLLYIPAVIYHGNTLSMEKFDRWVTPSYVLGNWCCEGLRPKPKQKIELKEDDNGQLKFA